MHVTASTIAGRDVLRSMTVEDRDAQAVTAARALLGDAVRRLAESGARDEAIGEYVQPRAVLGVKREPTMRSLGTRVWRIGALLLGRDGRVWATGRITRVTPAGRAQYQSTSAEVRRAYRAAAERGHFDEGDTVNHEVVAIALDEGLVGAVGPLFVRDGAALVRWSPTAGDDAAVPLADYLRDRVDLLAHPLPGATD